MTTKCPEKRRAEWKRYYEKNREQLLEKQKSSPEKKVYAKVRYKEKREDIRTKQSEYAKTPCAKAKKTSREAERRARKNWATPDWLSDSQKSEIRDLYWLCADICLTTGEPYHVDHIIPLKGKNVCGLHVPWNLQILPADMNLIKSNKGA